MIILDTKNLDIQEIHETSNINLSWLLDTQNSLEALGTPLKITLSPYEKGDKFTLYIQYSTTSKSSASQWMTPEMTLGKKYPFMYTQCQAIQCRSLLPCQDSPSVKVKVLASITVPNPLVALYSGI